MNRNKFVTLRVAFSVGPSTVIALAGLLLHREPFAPLLAAAEFGGSLVAAYIAFNRDQKIPWIFAGGFAYAAGCVLLGFHYYTLYLWAAAVGGSFGLRLWFEHTIKHAGGNLDVKLKRAQLGMAEVRKQQAEVRLERMVYGNAPMLGQQGMLALGTASSGEEAQLRTAFHNLYKTNLLGCSVEPTSSGYRVVLSLPPEVTREKLRNEWNRMTGALAATGRYTLEDGDADNQLIIRYSAGDMFAEVIPYTPDAGEKVEDPVWLGPDADGEDTLLKLLGRHTLILGTSGNGKSNITNLIILAAVRRGMAVLAIDMKKGVELAALAPLFVTLATNGDQARDIFDWLDAETDRRAEIMIREGIQDWEEEFGPYILLVVDELSELTDKKWKVDGLPSLAELNEAASRIYRAFGIFLVAATQAPSAKAFGGNTDARTNYKNRIGTRCEEAGHAAFGFGVSWKSNGWDLNGVLGGPGEYMLSNQEHRKPIARKAPYLSKADRATEVQRLLPYRVGLDGSPWGESGVALTVDTRVLNLLRHRGEITRKEIEDGLGLDQKQVLNALDRLRRRKGVEISRDSSSGTYQMVSEDLRERIPLVEAPE